MHLYRVKKSSHSQAHCPANSKTYRNDPALLHSTPCKAMLEKGGHQRWTNACNWQCSEEHEKSALRSPKGHVCHTLPDRSYAQPINLDKERHIKRKARAASSNIHTKRLKSVQLRSRKHVNYAPQLRHSACSGLSALNCAMALWEASAASGVLPPAFLTLSTSTVNLVASVAALVRR